MPTVANFFAYLLLYRLTAILGRLLRVELITLEAEMSICQ